MSRNLARTDCAFCSGTVALGEVPRPITLGEAGVYLDEYRGMLVARAECVDCEAKYLAWVQPPAGPPHWGRPTLPLTEPAPFYDLSFRSTFNDEHGPADVPAYQIETIRRRKGPWQDPHAP